MKIVAKAAGQVVAQSDCEVTQEEDLQKTVRKAFVRL